MTIPSFPCNFLAALIPATIPCAAASSYPELPLNCPPLNNPSIFLNSNVLFNCLASIQSYSIAYAFLTIFACSKPGTLLYIAYWTSSGNELDIPPTYISFVWIPSGSIKTWCLFLSGNFTTLSSIDGQYLGPVPSIAPENSGDLSRFSRMISCVVSFVYVSQHDTWSIWTSSGSVVKEKGTTLSSPFCSSIFVKSIEFLSILAGVPVLNLYILIPSDFKLSVR